MKSQGLLQAARQVSCKPRRIPESSAATPCAGISVVCLATIHPTGSTFRFTEGVGKNGFARGDCTRITDHVEDADIISFVLRLALLRRCAACKRCLQLNNFYLELCSGSSQEL